MVDAQRQACIDAGIEDVTNPRDDTLKAIERTRERTAQIELALESAKEIGEMVRALEQRGVVARELGKHLKANAFERWVLRQALTTLVDGATGIMLELSSGQYSLTLDKQFNFAVVDHRNADATRSARTLSGGETFLASLSLALAMSDRTALRPRTSVPKKPPRRSNDRSRSPRVRGRRSDPVSSRPVTSRSSTEPTASTRRSGSTNRTATCARGSARPTRPAPSCATAWRASRTCASGVACSPHRRSPSRSRPVTSRTRCARRTARTDNSA